MLESGVAAGVKTEVSRGVETKFVTVSGLSDPEIQEKLNQELYAFSTWGLGGSDEDDVTTEGIDFKYSLVGNYISVRRFDTTTRKDAAYPVNNIRSLVFDLETGEYAGGLYEFIDSGLDLIEAVKSGKFVQVYPETAIDGADDVLAAYIADFI